ncbi:unnamed protein product [Owenia fusiformis]|uniref:C2H2-type domain-containing protein n=1 Tax=Owenia fusiformis TaxID=6347 RepID=A0A8S4PUK7_OWEFU|nr:unnamed protein product [Owenia fusiformis]
MMVRLKNLVDKTVEKVDIRRKYSARQLDMQTAYIEKLVSDIRRKVGLREPALATNEQINRGSYYDGTKILDPDEYDYEPILDLSKHITNVTEPMPGLKEQGYKTILFREKELHKHIHEQYLVRTFPNGKDAELKCRELLAKIRQNVNRVLEDMHKEGTVMFIGECDHTKDPKDYDKNTREISTHNAPHGPSVWLRVGAPLGTTDIDMCFCLKWKPHELGPSVMVPTNKGWLESVVSLPDNSIYKLTPVHKNLLLTVKYVTHLTSALMSSKFSYSVSSYILKAVILHHQTECRSDNIDKCFIAIIYDMMLKPNEEFDEHENVVFLTNRHIEIPDIVYREKALQISGEKRVSLLISMLWVVQHVKLNSNTDWFDAFLRNDKGEIKKNSTLRSLNESLKKFFKITDTGKVDFEWQHDKMKTSVRVTGVNSKEDRLKSGRKGVKNQRSETHTSDQPAYGLVPKTENSRKKKNDENKYGSKPSAQDQAQLPEPAALQVPVASSQRKGQTPTKTCSKRSPPEKTKKQAKCEQTNDNKEKVVKHLATPTVEKKYECAKCMTAFKAKSTLRNHEEICQRTDKPFHCKVCRKSFKAERYLKEHIKGHENPEQYECDICGDKFPYRGTLQGHKRSKHK